MAVSAKPLRLQVGRTSKWMMEGCPMVLFVSLIAWRSKWLHIAGPLLLLGFYFMIFWSATLSIQMR